VALRSYIFGGNNSSNGRAYRVVTDTLQLAMVSNKNYSQIFQHFIDCSAVLADAARAKQKLRMLDEQHAVFINNDEICLLQHPVFNIAL
jgi:hypothetical protein